MQQRTIKFTSREGMDFHRELRERVNQYFKGKGLSKNAPRIVWLKTAVMISLYVLPFVAAQVFFADSPILYILMFVLMGLGMAGIGMNVTHDANHGSLSRNRRVNRLLGSLLYLIGVDKATWQQEHNVEHHTFTNIPGHDTDISVPIILRFSTEQKRLGIHRLQHVYAWFLYSLITLRWATIGDFVRLRKNQREDPQPDYGKKVLQLAGWKLSYHLYIWIIPVLLFGVALGPALLAVLIMHLVASTIMGIIFQTAHAMPECAFPIPDEANRIESSWAVHQMETTCNYALNGPRFSWFVGGLNYQIEHHLFPNISHYHYPQISKIVQATAEKYGVPYRTYRTFLDALRAHRNFLKQLGTEG
ncbi:MAG: acyl-CoA desaturase [Bacteroidota bacterium]